MKEKFYKLGIIGYPLAHSISPVIQRIAFESTGLKGSYEKFEVSVENLQKQLDFFKKNGFSGFNVTIPHKIEILKYLDFVDPLAEKIGAVNTVKITDEGRLEGYNTDIYGFVEAIPDSFRCKKINSAKILGCGGAALAVVWGLYELGCRSFIICARDCQKAEKFIKELCNMRADFQIENIDAQASLENTDILVNCTPLGTVGCNQDKMPIAMEVLQTGKKELFVYDLVYNPSETLFLKNANIFGYKNINGLDMLILQGAKGFEIWTGKSPSVSLMKSAIVF